MDIRKIQFEELKEVLNLIDEFERTKAGRPTDARLELIFSQLQASNGCVMGAFETDRLVGTCTLNVCPNLSWSGRPYALIENVIVTKSMRNKGIGKMLLKEVQIEAEKIGCYKVALMTGSKRIETHKFYESAGFIASKTGFQVRFNA